MMTKQDDRHWLVQTRTVRGLAIAGCGLLVMTILAQFLIKIKGYFGIDEWFGFGALFGFLCCAAMVLVAKSLGRFLKREEHFYDD